MGSKPESLVIAKAKAEIAIIPKMANRHGLIAGATGTGKTVTLADLGRTVQRHRDACFYGGCEGGPLRACLFRAAKIPR